MQYTKFGEMLRILRIKHHEVMGDLADVLNIKPSFLSAVETGRKNVPLDWIDILVDHYQLTDTEIAEMKEAIELSKNQLKIDLQEASIYQREMALQFQRSFNDIDEETSRKILELLNHQEDI